MLLVLVVLAGCSSKVDPPAPALVEAWREESFRPIGQPVAVGDMVVSYGTVGKDLLLFGVPVKEGGIRWRQAATPSHTTSGIPLTPAVIDGRVAYLRPDRIAPLAARLVVASPQTGADLLVSVPLPFESQPSECAEGKDVCARVQDGDDSVSRRFSVESGGQVPDPSALSRGSRWLGTDLIDPGQRGPELLAGFQGGVVRWRSPLSLHFSEGFSTDDGWDFELYRSAGLHVGTVGSPSDRSGPVANVRDWSKVETAGIRTADGSSAWRSQGTSFSCNQRIELRRPAPAGETEAWPVRCRLRGIGRYERSTGIATFEGLDVTVEGFDVVTGTTTWSVPLGAAEGFMKEDRKATAVTEVEVLVQSGTGPLIIDLSNGSTRRPALGQAFWCATLNVFEYREARQLRSGGTANTWRGGVLLERCGADGSPTTAMPTSLPASLGATVDGRTVIAQADGLVAYDRR